MNDPGVNKMSVLEFYHLAFNEGQPAEAVAKYFGPVYSQHNPGLPDGAQSLIEFVISFKSQFPELHLDVKRSVAEGDLVVVHAHMKTSPNDTGTAVMDIFRSNDGKIVEHWDVLQTVPATAANTNTMF